MGTLNRILIFGILFSLLSCSEDKSRVLEMENQLDLQIPDNYTQIENKTEGGLGPDYSVTVELQFDKINLDIVAEQIVKSPYFNRATVEDANDSLAKLLSDINRRGIWRKSKNGFDFIDYKRTSEPVTAELDTIKRTLSYTLTHL